MSDHIYRKGDEVEVTRRGVIVEVDPNDPARYGIGRPGGFGADAYFRTDDDKVRHRLVDENPDSVLTAVDAFEVVAEGDVLILACPNMPCRTRHQMANDWYAELGDLIRAALGHEHSYADNEGPSQ